MDYGRAPTKSLPLRGENREALVRESPGFADVVGRLRHPAEADLYESPNDSVTSFVNDILWLSTTADSQATKKKILRVLMKGVKSKILGGLVRNPPTIVDGFVTEATNIERALTARARHYHRINDVSTLASARSEFSTSADEVREVIRDVVRKELKNLPPAADPPASLSIAEVVQEELQRAIEKRAVV